MEGACLALVGGSSLAEFFSFFILFLQAQADKKRYPLRGGGMGGEGKAILGFALPCAASAYARSGLVTLEHLLIPVCLSMGEAAGAAAAIAVKDGISTREVDVASLPRK